MEKTARVCVAGSRGMVGSAIVRRLREAGFEDIQELARDQADLTRADEVDKWFKANRPEYLFIAAAKVGGVLANDLYSADFLRVNLQIQTNLIDCAHRYKVTKLLFLGSSCIYPKHAPQPMREEHLMTGLLEPTNDAYAIAKIAGIKMVEAYGKQYGLRGISLMPTNLYGPGDNFDLQTAHVLPAMVRKFLEAKVEGKPSVGLWGSGTPRREFLHVDDLASAALFLMENYDGPGIINVGVGEDISIAGLAALIAEVVGYEGEIVYDATKPDGTPRKWLDVSRLEGLGWSASTSLRDGIVATVAWYTEHHMNPSAL
ncbi:MAG: GDP-L-fucose synthase [Planctomycetota bacterium]|jgi:GDP-L-fucose synthase